MLSREDQKRIADAVTAAEEKTDGEITCVLAQEVSNYREVPLGWAALAALGLPPLLVLAGLERLALADIFASWTDESLHAVENLILRVEATVKAYTYRHAGDYLIWPRPNSNSLTAAVLRAMPELGVTLPPNAVGRDFRRRPYVGLTDSRIGIEINLFGIAAFKIGWVEGVELDLLGLVAGLDLRHPGIKLPGFGRIGVEAPVATALAR